MYEIDSTRIDLKDIQGRFLEPGFLFLLEVDDDQYVALRCVRNKRMFLQYSFQQEISGWLPLAPVGETGTSGTDQDSYLENQDVYIHSLNIDTENALGVDSTNSNNMLQLFFGIKPSYLNVNLRYPNTTANYQMPRSKLFPSSAYPYLFGASGYSSRYLHPSRDTEFFSMISTGFKFDLANTASYDIQPELMFVINNIITAPVTDKEKVKRILEGQGVPRKIVALGSIYGSVPFPSTQYSGAKVFKAKDLGVN